MLVLNLFGVVELFCDCVSNCGVLLRATSLVCLRVVYFVDCCAGIRVLRNYCGFCFRTLVYVCVVFDVWWLVCLFEVACICFVSFVEWFGFG